MTEKSADIIHIELPHLEILSEEDLAAARRICRQHREEERLLAAPSLSDYDVIMEIEACVTPILEAWELEKRCPKEHQYISDSITGALMTRFGRNLSASLVEMETPGDLS